jgi:hypothetical protein
VPIAKTNKRWHGPYSKRCPCCFGDTLTNEHAAIISKTNQPFVERRVPKR